MKSLLTLVFTVALIGTTVVQAQDRGGWEFFNFREVQEEVRDERQTILPTFQSSEPFDDLVAQCAAIESQFGRACDAEKVKEILATSVIFESDAARMSDELPPDGDVVSAANTVLKGASQEELKGYAWGLLYENAAYFKGEMYQMMKDAKMARMTDFTKALKDSMAMMAGIEKAKLTGKSDGSGGESGDDADAASKKYMSGGHGMTNFGAIGKPSVEESCLKAATKWVLPKKGGGFGPGVGSMTGDAAPDSGNIPMGPDGKPMSAADKLAKTKVDCSMVDPQKLNAGDSVGYDPDKADGVKGGGAVGSGSSEWKESSGSAAFEGSGYDDDGNEYSIGGLTEAKDDFYKDANGQVHYLGTNYEHTANVMNTSTGQNAVVKQTTNSPNPPKQTPLPGGQTVQSKAKTKKGSETGAMKPEEQAKPEKEKKAEKEKPKKPNKKGYDDPNAEDGGKGQVCSKLVTNTFNDCVMAALKKDFEDYGAKKEDPCDPTTSWVAGEVQPLGPGGGGGGGNDNTSKTGGKNCQKKSSIQGLDKQMIFLKSGGGVTDPMMKQMQQGGTAQPLQDGSFK